MTLMQPTPDESHTATRTTSAGPVGPLRIPLGRAGGLTPPALPSGTGGGSGLLEGRGGCLRPNPPRSSSSPLPLAMLAPQRLSAVADATASTFFFGYRPHPTRGE